MPEWLYAILGTVTGLIAVATVALIARVRDRTSLKLVAFFATTLRSVLALLHVSDYRSVIAGNGPLVQGRYLLPGSALFALAVAFVTNRPPGRWRGVLAGALTGALLLLQIVALATVAKRYYT
jgi:di/tricarboxylate transporter